jgi:hypothetical protein
VIVVPVREGLTVTVAAEQAVLGAGVVLSVAMTEYWVVDVGDAV